MPFFKTDLLNISRRIFRHKLFQNSVVYILAHVLRTGIPFLLLPVLTRYLTPADYGYFSVFEIFINILIIFVSLNISSAVAVAFYKKDSAQFQVYLGNGIILTLISFIITLSIIVIFHQPLTAFLNVSSGWLILGACAALMNAFFTLLLIVLQMKGKAEIYGSLQIVQMLLNVVISLFLIIKAEWGWQGRVLGIVLSYLIVGSISLYILIRNMKVRFLPNTDYIRDIFKFSAPLIPHTLSGWIMTSTDRIMINTMVGSFQTGLYSISFQIGMIIELIASSFNQAWSPFLFRVLSENDHEKRVKLVKITYLCFILLIGMVFFLKLLTPLIFRYFINEKYAGGMQIVEWVLWACVAHAMYHLVVGYIYFAQKTHLLFQVSIFAALLNVVLNFYFIRSNGVVGAAQATAISAFVNFLLIWYVSSRLVKMPWLFWKNTK